VGNVGDHARALLRICMTTLRSAFPVRMSYNVNVRSEPTLAKTDDSLILKRTAVIVSVDEGNVRSDMGVLIDSSHTWTIFDAVAKRGSDR